MSSVDFSVQSTHWTGINSLYLIQGELDQIKARFDNIVTNNDLNATQNSCVDRMLSAHPYNDVIQNLKEISVDKLDEIWKNRASKYVLKPNHLIENFKKYRKKAICQYLNSI